MRLMQTADIGEETWRRGNGNEETGWREKMGMFD